MTARAFGVLRRRPRMPAGLIDRKAPGARPKLDAAQRQALAERVDRGPIPAVDGVVRWRPLKKLPRRAGGGPRQAPDRHPDRALVAGRGQDEARIGQKTKITRRWARRGTRPRTPKDQCTKSAYIFSAICPARGTGAALVLPKCDTQAMPWHLEEISSQVSPGAHAVVILDQAGWHGSSKLQTPANITLLHLPPRAPALNPVENV